MQHPISVYLLKVAQSQCLCEEEVTMGIVFTNQFDYTLIRDFDVLVFVKRKELFKLMFPSFVIPTPTDFDPILRIVNIKTA
jgi:hypothetical protein